MDPIREKPILKDEQPTPESLANLGILVRDFAFENTGLPPVRTIYRHPRQVQPGVNRNPGVQRQLTETAEDGAFSQPSQESSQPLERTVTEPALPPARPTREQGFLNLEELDEPLIASQAPTHPESQNSNGIRTPLVTPNGSLQWDHPASNVPIPPVNLAATATVPEIPLLSSQRPLSQSMSTFAKQSTPDGLSRRSTLSTLSSPSSVSPSPIPTRHKKLSPCRKLRRQPSHKLKHNDISNNNTTLEKPARRYNLRKRPTKATDTINNSPPKRMKFTHAEPAARPSLSVQSMQLRNKPNGGEGSRISCPRPVKRTKRKM